MDNNDRFSEIYNLLMNVTSVTNDWEYKDFGSFYCMVLEEWCKAHGYDLTKVLPVVVETFNTLYKIDGSYTDDSNNDDILF